MLQATYTPLRSKEPVPGQPVFIFKRPFEHVNPVKSIAPTDQEVAHVKSNYKESSDHKNKDKDHSHKEFLKTIKTIEHVIIDLENLYVLANVTRFSEINTDVFIGGE